MVNKRELLIELFLKKFIEIFNVLRNNKVQYESLKKLRLSQNESN